MMSMGDEVSFKDERNNSTFLNIRRKRRLNPKDFAKQFKVLPKSFVPSFIGEQWTKALKNLPASVFKPTIDPTTMLYRDYLPPDPQQASQYKKVPKPGNPSASTLRLTPTELGGQILLAKAQGVPLPEENDKFNRKQIVKRAVRVGLYDSDLNQFIANTAQVNVIYDEKAS